MLHLDVDANLDINHCLAYSEVTFCGLILVHPKFVESQEAHIYPAISSTLVASPLKRDAAQPLLLCGVSRHLCVAHLLVVCMHWVLVALLEKIVINLQTFT